MIKIDLGTIEIYDDNTNQFEIIDGGVVSFEYSLKAIYDWEGKWKKPFLKGELNEEELRDFYKFMAIDKLDDRFLTNDVMNILSKYISDSKTATTFTSHGNSQNGSRTLSYKTAEEFYAMMAMNGIPLDFENRNFNRLITILRIIAHKNEPPKKMSKDDIYRQNRELNKMRKEQLKTRG